MSCLNLRLPPAKKAWQRFTSNLQSKLHKLNKSKNIKKTRHNTFTSTSKSVAVRPSSSVVLSDIHNKKRRRLFSPFFKPRRNRNHFFRRKKTAPVYIDKLFVGPPVAADGEVVAKCPARAKTTKVEELTQKGDGQADDMWESLGFASPQMQGIDERAEQFIASFRAEMEVQEMIERDLCHNNIDSS